MEYKKNTNLLDSTFECIKCEDLYYLSENTCKLRLNTDK